MAKKRLEVERFKLVTRCLHWVIALACITLAVTGLFFFVPAFGAVTQDSYTRVIHKIAAIVFIGSPALYFVLRPKESLEFLKDAVKWGKDDFNWLKAAPDYYFGGNPKNMPPQEHINTGQKLFWVVCIFSTVLFAISGLIMWVTGVKSSNIFLGAAITHDITLIIGGLMLIVHMYLGTVHPKMTDALRSMVLGKSTVEYAKSHHGKWFEKEVRSKEPE